MSAIIKVERRNTNGNFNVMDDRKGMSGYNEYVVTMKSDGNVRRKHVVMATSAEDAAKRVADRENAPMRAVVNVEQRKLRR